MSASQQADCPFCQLAAERILAANEHAVAVLDAYPVSPGHTLIVSRRHVASLFDLTAPEVFAIQELLFVPVHESRVTNV